MRPTRTIRKSRRSSIFTGMVNSPLKKCSDARAVSFGLGECAKTQANQLIRRGFRSAGTTAAARPSRTRARCAGGRRPRPSRIFSRAWRHGHRARASVSSAESSSAPASPHGTPSRRPAARTATQLQCDMASGGWRGTNAGKQPLRVVVASAARSILEDRPVHVLSCSMKSKR